MDDDLDFQAWVRRALGTRFDVSVVPSAEQAIRHVEAHGPVHVVLSDLRMAGSDGLALLGVFRERWPDSVRILITAHADLQVAVIAVNQDHVFRFLEKPCTPHDLVAAVRSAAEQHRLITSERLLLEKTVHGSIGMLSELMSFSDPVAFGRAQRIRRIAGGLAQKMGAPCWEVEAAAMLSQIGSVVLPRPVAEKLDQGQPLEAREQALVDEVPLLSERLLGGIPRLEGVREILRYQAKRFDGGGVPRDDDTAEARIPVGARILKILLDHDQLERAGVPRETALQTLAERKGAYDPLLLDAFSQLESAGPERVDVADVSVAELTVGMVLMDDAVASDGRLLLMAGQELSVRAVETLRGFAENTGVKEPLRVVRR